MGVFRDESDDPLASPKAKDLIRKCMALMGDRDLIDFFAAHADESSRKLAALANHCALTATPGTLTPFETLLDSHKLRWFKLDLPGEPKHAFNLDRDAGNLRRSLMVAMKLDHSDTLPHNLDIISAAYHIYRENLAHPKPDGPEGQQLFDFNRATVMEYIDTVIQHVDDLRRLVNKKTLKVNFREGR